MKINLRFNLKNILFNTGAISIIYVCVYGSIVLTIMWKIYVWCVILDPLFNTWLQYVNERKLCTSKIKTGSTPKKTKTKTPRKKKRINLNVVKHPYFDYQFSTKRSKKLKLIKTVYK